MTEKMDKILAKTLCSENNECAHCLVYVENICNAKSFFEREGIEVIKDFPFIKAISVRATIQNLKKLSKSKIVNYVSSESTVFAMMNVAREILNVDGDHSLGTIAYIDTGIFPHLDFTLRENRIIKFLDLINYRLRPYDDNGHGTFVSGVGSGSGISSNKKYAGICPMSKIVSIKALNHEGEASATKILEAMEWVHKNHKKFRIKTVCMSFGSEPLGANDPIMKGAEELCAVGVTVVAAAGNSGPQNESIKSPGISEKVITVGGFDDNRLSESKYNKAFFEIANFSSRGPVQSLVKPDIVAPAVEIHSCGISSPYTVLSGTSVATPMIAGLCSILAFSNPTLSPQEIKSLLLSTCTPITCNKNKEGAGFPQLNKIL